jgi:hypothetical protein
MKKDSLVGHAIAQAASRWLPTAASRVRARMKSCGNCGGQSGTGVFSEYFDVACQSLQRLLHTHHHPSSGDDTTGQIEADVTSGPSFLPPEENKKKVVWYKHRRNEQFVYRASLKVSVVETI